MSDVDANEIRSAEHEPVVETTEVTTDAIHTGDVALKVFVRNIGKDASDDTVKALCEDIGPVTECVCRDARNGKNAFVTFENADDAKTAIEKLTGRDVGGATITVEAKNPPKDRACFNCGKGGHLSKNCPEKKRGRDRRDTGRDRDGCFKCGKPGHFARECPNGGGGGEVRGRGGRGGNRRRDDSREMRRRRDDSRDYRRRRDDSRDYRRRDDSRDYRRRDDSRDYRRRDDSRDRNRRREDSREYRRRDDSRDRR